MTDQIVHLTTLEHGGGTETFTERLCTLNDDFEWLSLQGLGAFPLRPNKLGKLKNQWNSSPPKAVFAYGVTAQLAAVLTLPRRIPIIGVIHGEIDFEGQKDWVRRLYEKRVCWWVGNSGAVLDRPNGSIIWNGIFEGEPPVISPKKPSYDFGVLANGGDVKGHRFLIELFRNEPELGTLAFAGNLSEELMLEAKEAGIDCVGYARSADFVDSIYTLLMPSVSESFPTVIAEALGRGKPVVANPCGGVSEILGKYCPEMVVPRAQWRRFLSEFDRDFFQIQASKVAAQVREDFSFVTSSTNFRHLCEELLP